jgi:hypothetical protein
MHDLATVIDEQKVGYPHMAKIYAQGIDPEMVGLFRVLHGDVAGRPVIETILRK